LRGELGCDGGARDREAVVGAGGGRDREVRDRIAGLVPHVEDAGPGDRVAEVTGHGCIGREARIPDLGAGVGARLEAEHEGERRTELEVDEAAQGDGHALSRRIRGRERPCLDEHRLAGQEVGSGADHAGDARAIGHREQVLGAAGAIGLARRAVGRLGVRCRQGTLDPGAQHHGACLPVARRARYRDDVVEASPAPGISASFGGHPADARHGDDVERRITPVELANDGGDCIGELGRDRHVEARDAGTGGLLEIVHDFDHGAVIALIAGANVSEKLTVRHAESLGQEAQEVVAVRAGHGGEREEARERGAAAKVAGWTMAVLDDLGHGNLPVDSGRDPAAPRRPGPSREFGRPDDRFPATVAMK